jgi:hypothetical protein
VKACWAWGLLEWWVSFSFLDVSVISLRIPNSFSSALDGLGWGSIGRLALILFDAY